MKKVKNQTKSSANTNRDGLRRIKKFSKGSVMPKIIGTTGIGILMDTCAIKRQF